MTSIMSDSRAHCSIAVEDNFGPIVAGLCLGGFDFTLLFEEAILTILPLGIAGIWALLRIRVLLQQTSKVQSSWLLPLKMLLLATYVFIQAAVFAVTIIYEIPRTRLTLWCYASTIVVYGILLSVSYLEHLRSVRPSTLLSVYLGTSILLDTARARTLFFIPENETVARLFLAGFTDKILIFILEVSEKRRLLRPKWQDASPEETSGAINRALFLWLNHIFLQGFRTLLTVDALTPLDSDLLEASKPSKLVKRWEEADKSSDNALLWTFLAHYKWSLGAGIIPRLVYSGFSFSQPFLVGRVLDFTAETRGPNSQNIAYALIAAYAIVYIGISLSFSVYQHKTYRLLTLFRGSIIALVFDKTLRINSSAVENAEAITLMSADIDRIGSSMTLVHEIYASFIDGALAIYLLYRLLGIAVLPPLVWIVVCLLIGLPLAKAAGNAQTPWLEAIEDRLAATAKVLGAMKAIKATGLTDIVSSRVENLRLAEIHASLRHRVLIVFSAVISFASTALAPVFGFATYILLDKANDSLGLTEGIAFASLSAFELLDGPMVVVIDGFEHIQTVINSFRRVQEYLLSEERDDYRSSLEDIRPSSRSRVSRYQRYDGNTVLEGSPRSNLVGPESEVIVEDASASYVPEDDPVLQNLSFQIPRGQTTMIFGPVGSGKSTLLKLLLGEMPYVTGSVATGFTKAAYCPQSPWSTWGTVRSNVVGMSVWDEKWYNTVVSACALSEDFTELANGDQTATGSEGSGLSGGQKMRLSFARALYSRNPVMILDDVLTGLDRATERHIIDAVFGPKGLLEKLNSTVVLATNSAHHLSFANHFIFLDGGEIVQKGPVDSLSADGGDVLEKVMSQPAAITARPEPEIPEEAQDALKQLELLRLGHDTGDIQIYAYYANIAGWWTIAAYLLGCVTFVFGMTFPSVWLQWWVNANADHPNDRVGYWLGVFGALGVVTILGCALADTMFNMVVLPKTGIRFHELLLSTTMQARTSFLTSTDAGTTLNRFSQDLELIDNDLPQSIDETISQFLSVIVSAVFVFIGSGYVIAVLPLCIIALGLIQVYYLQTSRQLRLLDIEAKAPLFSQFLETVNGVACIRAYGWSQEYTEQNYEALNRSQKPYYLLWCIQRWLTLVLDLLNAGVATLVVALATNLEGGSTGFLGVALFNIVIFSSTLQGLVTAWTQVETALGAINRIRSFILNVENENQEGEVGTVPDDWPQRGGIVFEDISASYEASLGPVLKEISFSIRPGEKIAICGRTGSGKSSLISTILRMLEIESGTITIDDVDITTVPRQDVRSRLNTFSQETFFLHGSVRENIDPLETASDERIIEVLRAVCMWDYFESRDGLDGDVEEEKLSHGQRQLFCLARAIIKPGRILIIDEATSSMDSETDKLMQQVLRKEFEGRTIIAIAHKLHTVLDFDRVMLLEKGRIVETGNPQELLEKETSAFRALYKSLGEEVE
ncbi:hypothetical protein VE03_06254 [Pseudogymnoascus sp. 23342-1-I1]|nr:hypothetical protein VE03_06254 [Pseudogymnoascus sp. 23342-1-I1]